MESYNYHIVNHKSAFNDPISGLLAKNHLPSSISQGCYPEPTFIHPRLTNGFKVNPLSLHSIFRYQHFDKDVKEPLNPNEMLNGLDQVKEFSLRCLTSHLVENNSTRTIKSGIPKSDPLKVTYSRKRSVSFCKSSEHQKASSSEECLRNKSVKLETTGSQLNAVLHVQGNGTLDGRDLMSGVERKCDNLYCYSDDVVVSRSGSNRMITNLTAKHSIENHSEKRSPTLEFQQNQKLLRFGSANVDNLYYPNSAHSFQSKSKIVENDAEDTNTFISNSIVKSEVESLVQNSSNPTSLCPVTESHTVHSIERFLTRSSSSADKLLPPSQPSLPNFPNHFENTTSPTAITAFTAIPTSVAALAATAAAFLFNHPPGQGTKRLFSCSQCRYVTDRKNNLKRHVMTMHQKCEKSLECCGVMFPSKALLRDHVNIFHGCGYMCRYCGRNFCRKALLKRHLAVHSGVKEFTCSQCDYATSHKSNLERHRKVHDRCDSFKVNPTSEQDDEEVMSDIDVVNMMSDSDEYEEGDGDYNISKSGCRDRSNHSAVRTDISTRFNFEKDEIIHRSSSRATSEELESESKLNLDTFSHNQENVTSAFGDSKNLVLLSSTMQGRLNSSTAYRVEYPPSSAEQSHPSINLNDNTPFKDSEILFKDQHQYKCKMEDLQNRISFPATIRSDEGPHDKVSSSKVHSDEMIKNEDSSSSQDIDDQRRDELLQLNSSQSSLCRRTVSCGTRLTGVENDATSVNVLPKVNKNLSHIYSKSRFNDKGDNGLASDNISSAESEFEIRTPYSMCCCSESCPGAVMDASNRIRHFVDLARDLTQSSTSSLSTSRLKNTSTNTSSVSTCRLGNTASNTSSLSTYHLEKTSSAQLPSATAILLKSDSRMSDGSQLEIEKSGSSILPEISQINQLYYPGSDSSNNKECGTSIPSLHGSPTSLQGTVSAGLEEKYFNSTQFSVEKLIKPRQHNLLNLYLADCRDRPQQQFNPLPVANFPDEIYCKPVRADRHKDLGEPSRTLEILEKARNHGNFCAAKEESSRRACCQHECHSVEFKELNANNWITNDHKNVLDHRDESDDEEDDDEDDDEDIDVVGFHCKNY